MKVQHSATPRLIGGRLLRLAWKVTGYLPKPLRRRTGLGKWRSSVAEWAWVHSQACYCHGCRERRYAIGQANLAAGVAHKGYLLATGFATPDEVKAAYESAFAYGD